MSASTCGAVLVYVVDGSSREPHTCVLPELHVGHHDDGNGFMWTRYPFHAWRES